MFIGQTLSRIYQATPLWWHVQNINFYGEIYWWYFKGNNSCSKSFSQCPTIMENWFRIGNVVNNKFLCLKCLMLPLFGSYRPIRYPRRCELYWRGIISPKFTKRRILGFWTNLFNGWCQYNNTIKQARNRFPRRWFFLPEVWFSFEIGILM